MTLRTSCSLAGIGVAVLVGLTLGTSAVAAPANSAPSEASTDDTPNAGTLDICPAPTKPGDPGSESTENSIGVIDSITFRGSADQRVAHIEAHGFRPDDSLNIVNWAAYCEGRGDALGSAQASADGKLSVDWAIVAGVSNFFHFDHSSLGTAGATLAFFADDSGTTPPVDPRPEKPTVSTSPAGTAFTTLSVRGTGTAAIEVKDPNGKVVAGCRLVGGSASVTIPTPSSERRYAVTQTIDGVTSATAEVVLQQGVGSSVPAAPRTTWRSAPNFTVVLTVEGAPGATVRVHAEGSQHEVVAVTKIGRSGVKEISGLSPYQVGSGGSPDKAAYVTQTLEGATTRGPIEGQ